MLYILIVLNFNIGQSKTWVSSKVIYLLCYYKKSQKIALSHHGNNRQMKQLFLFLM